MVPGSVNAQERHGLEAGLLRKVFDEVQQVLSVFELAQVDTVSHIQTVGHDAHLENTHTLSHKRYPTLTIFLLLSPSMLFCLLPLPDSLLRMWSGLVGLI